MDPRLVSQVWAAIVFNRGPPNWDVSYRFNYTEVPSTLAPPTSNLQRGYNANPITTYTYSKPPQPGGLFSRNSNVDPVLYQNMPGFLSLQLMVDRWIINRTAPIVTADPATMLYSFAYMLGLALPPGPTQWSFAGQMNSLNTADPVLAQSIAAQLSQWMRSESYMPQTVDFVPFPITAYQTNGFYGVASQMFALFFLITYMYPVARLIRGLVAEKEMKIREGEGTAMRRCTACTSTATPALR